MSDEHKKKISKSMKGKLPKNFNYFLSKAHELKGKLSPNWRGGISFEPYCYKFNKKLKSEIRERDGFVCAECEMSEEEIKETLCVHHIDYDKKNNKERYQNLLKEYYKNNPDKFKGYYQKHKDWIKHYKKKISKLQEGN